MAGRIRAFDWAATPLGPIAGWPQSLRTIVDLMLGSPSMMSLVWGEAAIHLYNDGFTALLREHRALALGRSAYETFARSRDVFEADIAAGMAGRSARLVAQRYPVLRQGRLEEAWFDADYTPVRDEAGAVAGVLWTLNETTAQHVAEQALRASETRHRLLVESWTQAVWETDATGVVVTDSPSWRAYTGQTLGEWLGYGWLDAIHPDDRAYAERQWREAIQVRGLVNAEFRLRAPGGGWRWTNVRAAPVRDADGTIERWAGMNIDIDARKRAEAALRESEAKLRTLFDTIDHGYCVTEVQLDDHGDVVDLIVREVNRNWEALTGMSNPLHRRVRAMLPGLEGHWLDYYGEVFKTGRPVRHENYLSDVDRWFSAHYSLMGELGSRLIAVVFEDITARKKAEAGLKESEERQAFLLAFSDTLRSLTSAREIKAAACTRLGRKLGASRVYFVEMDEAKRTGFVHEDYTMHGVPSVEGRYDFDIFPATYERLRRGATWVVPDLAAEADLPPDERAVFGSAAVVAWIDVPLMKDGQVEAVLCVTQTEPRRWSAFEAHLVEETAERLWSAVRRGRVEVALRESEERFQQFGEASSDVLWMRDAETLQWVYLTPAFERIYGRDRATALAGDNMTGWVDLILPEDRRNAVESIERVRAGERVGFEYRIVRPSDGTVRWLRNTDFPMRDAAGRVSRIGGVGRDVTEEKAAAQRLEVLVNELQHRSRNLLGVVTAMANRTVGRGSSAESFLIRLKALSRAQALLSQGGADAVGVEALVRAELAAHTDNDRIVIDGPAVTLTSQQVQNFALALHELATNAVKYGALKEGTGQLSVTWELIPTMGGPRLALNWVETGVDVPPEAVTRRGYGRELIEQALAYALGGRTDYRLVADGVRCRIELPIA